MALLKVALTSFLWTFIRGDELILKHLEVSLSRKLIVRFILMNKLLI